ncbi:MAG: hypothetical protein NZ481_10175, partial [Candidatus Kapabacteria bacterium]|nr:hypothetical protein [Candidatus Kapabacteria bacterium]
IMFVGTWLDQPSTSVNNALANSTLTIYITELYGRVNLGEGLLTTYGPEILSFLFISSPLLSRNARTELVRRFEALKKREVFPLLTEIQQSDRRALDEVIFDEIGLTQGEREAVYEAVVELVRARLEKAQSV